MKLHNLIVQSMVLTALTACGDDAPVNSASEASASEASATGTSTDGPSTESSPTTGSTSVGDPTDTGAPTSSTGAPASCGDGKIDDGEACDEGAGNGPDGSCSSECTANGCPANTPIGVLARAPAGEGEAVAADAPVTLTFACTVDMATVTDDTVFVHGSQTGRREFTVAWDGTTATLQFARPLLPAERIDVTLTSEIRDSMGGALQPQVFHFTVASAPGAASYTMVPGDVGYNHAALGDLDGDGDVDIVRAYGQFYINDGSGVFSGAPFGPYCEQVALADIDGDHDLDILCAGGFNDPSALWINDGAANFTAGPDPALFFGMSGVSFVDFDGDGDLDAWAVTGATADADIVALNDGSGVFTSHVGGLGSNATYARAFADVDGDGDVDALIGNGNLDEQARVWLGDGLGGFTPGDAMFGIGPHGHDGLALADVNGDGRADAAILRYFGDPGQIWINDSAGVFSAGAGLGTNRVDGTLALDLDGDGDVDIVTTNDSFFVGSNHVLLNAGDGTFAGPLGFGGGGEEIAAGDVNGDGIIDIIVDDELYVGD